MNNKQFHFSHTAKNDCCDMHVVQKYGKIESCEGKEEKKVKELKNLHGWRNIASNNRLENKPK